MVKISSCSSMNSTIATTMSEVQYSTSQCRRAVCRGELPGTVPVDRVSIGSVSADYQDTMRIKSRFGRQNLLGGECGQGEGRVAQAAD